MKVRADELQAGMRIKLEIRTFVDCGDPTCNHKHIKRTPGAWSSWERWIHPVTAVITAVGADNSGHGDVRIKLDRPMPKQREVGLDSEGYPIVVANGTYDEDSIDTCMCTKWDSRSESEPPMDEYEVIA